MKISTHPPALRLMLAAIGVVACLACVVCAAPAEPAPAEPVADGDSPAAADPLAELATMEYRPLAPVEAAVRIAGSATLEQVAAFWADGFRQVHPKAVLTIDRTSTESGWQMLVEGKADIALLSRTFTADEIAAAGEREGRRPIVIAVGFDQLTWIVHETNPVAAILSSAETGIIPAGRAAGPPRWGEWTTNAAWGDVPVAVHGSPAGSGTRLYLTRLLGGAAGWPGPITDHDSITDVTEAVATDRGGLGLVGTAAANRPGIRRVPLEIAVDDFGEVAGAERTPDFRPLFIAAAAPAAGEWPAPLREFVAYVLSYPGQLDVAKDALVPLSRGEIHAQKERLGWPVER